MTDVLYKAASGWLLLFWNALFVPLRKVQEEGSIEKRSEEQSISKKNQLQRRCREARVSEVAQPQQLKRLHIKTKK